ncbi:MAG: hypothetical protein RLZZ628_4427 [Bacteroidota bacterium]|jgi:hypothetical protein
MNNFSEARNAASFYIQSAIVAQCVQRDPQEFLRLSELAFEAEKCAALFLLDRFENEPMRSVTFRSAAALALDCKKYLEAKKMVYQGLAGNAPEDIAQELMDIYEMAERELRLAEIPAAAIPVAKKPKATNYFWLKGTLTVADARQHQITIVLEDNKTAKVNVPKDLGEIVRNYWNEYVNAYILKQGKVLTLVEIDKIFLQKTA